MELIIQLLEDPLKALSYTKLPKFLRVISNETNFTWCKSSQYKKKGTINLKYIG